MREDTGHMHDAMPSGVAVRRSLLWDARKLYSLNYCLQGIRLSGFLETNAEPGQRTLSAFLKPDAATAGPSPPKRRNWNQTFMPREVRNSIDEEMEKIQSSHASQSRQLQPSDDAPAAQTASSRGQDQRLQLAEAANCSTAQHSAADGVQPLPVQGNGVQSQAGTSQGVGGPSQNLELSLRDWAPPTASQVIAASQQQQDQQPQTTTNHAAEAGTEVSRGQEASQGDPRHCRDILDTAAPGDATLNQDPCINIHSRSQWICICICPSNKLSMSAS